MALARTIVLHRGTVLVEDVVWANAAVLATVGGAQLRTP
jgi:hypothetical protein